MGLFFHTFNHAIQVIFKVSFFWFVDAPVLCIFIPIKNPTYPPTIEPTKPQIKPENMKMTYYIKRKNESCFFNQGMLYINQIYFERNFRPVEKKLLARARPSQQLTELGPAQPNFFCNPQTVGSQQSRKSSSLLIRHMVHFSRSMTVSSVGSRQSTKRKHLRGCYA